MPEPQVWNVATPEDDGVQRYTRSGEFWLVPQLPDCVEEPVVAPTNVPPSAGSVAAAWHAVHPAAGGPPTHAPWLHTSFVVQLLPSVQEPLLLKWRHPSVGSQMSSVHGLASSQPEGVHWASAGAAPNRIEAPSSTPGSNLHMPNRPNRVLCFVG